MPKPRTHFGSLSCELLMQGPAINSTSKNASSRTWWSSECPPRLESFHVRFLLYSLTHMSPLGTNGIAFPTRIPVSPFHRFFHVLQKLSIDRKTVAKLWELTHIYPISTTRTILMRLVSTFHHVKHISMLGRRMRHNVKGGYYLAMRHSGPSAIASSIESYSK